MNDLDDFLMTWGWKKWTLLGLFTLGCCVIAFADVAIGRPIEAFGDMIWPAASVLFGYGIWKRNRGKYDA